MAVLEIRSQTAVLGDVGKKLKRHQDVLFARHTCDDLGVRDKVAVEKIAGHGGVRHGWLGGSRHGRAVGRETHGGNGRRSGVVGDGDIDGPHTVGDIKGVRLLRFGNRGRRDFNCGGLGEHGIAFFDGDILYIHSRLLVGGAGHFGVGRFVRLHIISHQIIGVLGGVIMPD